MAKPRITDLYRYYPRVMHPDGDFPSCAVRMSMCLEKAGIFDRAKYKAAGYHTSKSGWATAAEQLYQWLRLKSSLGAAQLMSTGRGLPTQYGIVYLRNCWARNREKAQDRSGDHIDLYFYHAQTRVGWILTAVLWPKHCRNNILTNCRDGKIRIWTCVP